MSGSHTPRRGGGSEARIRAHCEALVAGLGAGHPDIDRRIDAAVAAITADLRRPSLPDAADFRALVELAPDVWVVYRDHVILYANPVAGALLGYEPAALRGRPVLDLIDPIDHAEVEARVARLEAGSPVEPRETRLVRSDGTGMVFEVVSLPVQFEGAPAILAMARDVSVRHEVQARRLQANQALSFGSLAAGVAHEINNPLTYVVANLGYALRELRTPGFAASEDPTRFPELVEALSEAQEGAERVRVIVQNLRAFSRLDDARDDRIDVRRVVQSSVSLAATEIRSRARLVQDLRDVPPVMGSEGRLGQVFLNLLVNATQAIPEGASPDHEVRVSTYVDAEDQVVIEVRDTGAGIAPEARPRIFDPFFTTKPPGIGTGLGLSICLRIVSGLGGDITVESAPGEGSIFRVRLPIAPDQRPLPFAATL